MIQFSVEPLKDCWDETIELASMHWGETETYQVAPMNPDKDRYVHYNEIGYHYQIMAREEGKAVGYLGAYISTSMHTQEKIATEDNWFIHPDYRGGRTALRFYNYVEEFLKSKGVAQIIMHSKFANNSIRLMKHLGFVPVAYMCVKRL